MTDDDSRSSVTKHTGNLAVKRPVRRRRKRRLPPVDNSIGSDYGELSSETNSESPVGDSDDVPNTSPSGRVDMHVAPRPTHEVPVFWQPAERTDQVARTDFRQLLDTVIPGTSLVQLDREQETGDDRNGQPKVLNVNLVTVDTSKPTSRPRGLESLDLHSLQELHKHLQEERAKIPGELVVPGRIAGLALTMLVDSGASISVLSTSLWNAIHRTDPGWTLFPTDIHVRTVSGDEAKVRGRIVLELELAGQFYVHQFLVMDINEDLILGMDFIHKNAIDCDWRKGVLRLRGDELQACRSYSTGDGRLRKLIVAGKTVIPAGAQVVVETRVQTRGPGDLPEWGLTSPTRKSVAQYGVIAGKSLVDPLAAQIPIPVLNPGDSVVVLHKNAHIGFLSPVSRVTEPIASDAKATTAS